MIESTLRAGDGTDLAVRTTSPSGPARGIVQILHGMAEHAARYDALAADLAEAGYVVVTHDQRGHGRTAPHSLGHLADRDGWSLLVEDALQVGVAARAAHPDLPLVLLGHSMGSLVARTLVLRHSHAVDGLILSGTVANPGHVQRLAAKALALALGRVFGGSQPSPIMDKLVNGGFNKQFAPARTEFDWLSRDARAVDEYVADPASGFICSNRFYADLFTGLGMAVDRSRISGVRPDLPILLLSGDEDPVGNNGDGVVKVARSYRRAGLRDVTTCLYKGGRHEMFNELGRDEVVVDLLAWLNSHTAAATPSADVIPLRPEQARTDT